MTVMVVWGLLSPPCAPATERIERSTDEKGTIHIGNIGPADQEKAGETVGEVKAPSGPVSAEQPRSNAG